MIVGKNDVKTVDWIVIIQNFKNNSDFETHWYGKEVQPGEEVLTQNTTGDESDVIGEAVPVGISIIERTEPPKYLYVNSLWEEITEYSKDEIMHISPLDLIIQNEMENVRNRSIKRIQNLKAAETKEVILITKSGGEKWVELRIAPINYQGKIASITVATDITNKKYNRILLKESEERYQLLSDATFEAIFISEKGICINQNKTAEIMFGYSHEEAIGRPGTEWIVPEHREVVMKIMLAGYESHTRWLL